jgi:hypothetical protein
MKPSNTIALAMLGLYFAVGISDANEPRESSVKHAAGAFDVQIKMLQPDNDPARAANVGRMSIEKQYKGDLAASSTGEMLSSGDGTTSGSYVAIERVSGSLHGRKGSFMLVHHALMNRGTPENWIITVVPDSGTDELQGLKGSFRIIIDKGQHSYEFDYTLAD